jgi:hypothetical protein
VGIHRLALAGASYVDISEQIGNKESFIRREFYQKASKPEAEIYFSLTPARVQVTPSGRLWPRMMPPPGPAGQKAG